MDRTSPTSRATRSRLLVTLLGAGLLACGDSATEGSSGEPPSQIEECEEEALDVIEGEGLTYRAFGRNFEGVCSGSFAASEAHAQWIERVWGKPRVAEEFWLYANREEPCWPCSSSSIACVIENIAHAPTLPHRHELSHLIRETCPRLIEEGFASIYGDYFTYHKTVDEIEAAIVASDEGVLPGDYYGVAGAFVAFLMERDGVERLHEICALGVPANLPLAEALEQVYQVPLADLVAEFEAVPLVGNAYYKQELACDALKDGAELDIITSPSSWSMDLGCGAEGVEGIEGQYTMVEQLIELPITTNYDFNMLSKVDYTLRVELRHCDREGMASVYYINEFLPLKANVPRGLLFDSLPAGTYVMRVRTHKNSDGGNGPGLGELKVDVDLATWP